MHTMSFRDLHGRAGWALLLALAAPAAAPARSPYRQPVDFARTWSVGLGRSVFVVGSHADIGAWTPTGAVKLAWGPGDTWTGRVAVQAGTALEYKYIARADDAASWCDNGNVEWTPGANLATNVPAQSGAPYAGKTIFYHTGWTNADLVYRQGTNWYGVAMTREGEGRWPGEYRYRAGGVGEEGEELEFIPHGHLAGVEYWDHAPYGGYGNSNYDTTLDVFFLQDGQVYNYWPPAVLSASRVVTTAVSSSWAPTIPSRQIRIYLPRGYTTNTWKSYPVLYLHDGQNVFAPGGDYGCWYAERTADQEISQGRMRETILVAVDNSPERDRELCPPGDNEGSGPGTGNLYANFLVHNVRPTLDTHYRTRNDRANTLTAGSSMGGLISAYLGLETNVFGRVGAFSPAFLVASNFLGRIRANPTKGTVIYMDDGTINLDAELWPDTWYAYDLFLADGYAPNDDLRMVVGCGHDHNEAAWAARLPAAYRFLLDIRDEENLLARNRYPPAISNALRAAAPPGRVQLAVPTLAAQRYTLEQATNFPGGAWRSVTNFTETAPWSVRTLADTNPPDAGTLFYRVRVE